MSRDELDRPRLSLSRERMRALGYRVVDALVERWAGLPEAPIPSPPDRAALRETLLEPLPRVGRAPEAVIERALREVLAEAAPTGHPRFFGFIPSPSNFIAVLADTLVAGFNPFGGNWLEAPGPHELERITIGWIAEACGFPAEASGLFVSGGSMANLTALVAAREARGVDPREATLYVSDQTHASIAKAARVIGFPESALRVIPTGDDFAMRIDALAAAVERDPAPFAVIATAATTNTGAVDPLESIAELCAARGLWLHVDGAYGAAAMFSDRARGALRGLERADSLSLDPHKWLFTPYECACVILRDGSRLAATFARRADYLRDVAGDEPDFQDMGVQLTRSFRALKVWMTFQVFGADAIAEAIDAGIARAEHMAARVESMDGWSLAAPASMGILAFRCDALDDDAHAALVHRLVDTHEAMVSSTVLRGRRWLRACTNNPRTTDDDVDRTLATLRSLVD
ncbi:MAG: aminotransferase class I/II-fold pyridoxal phosphate-dependent enzyme [Myxococcota bacterium]|nr:aminotransferase class I/II-fold pyridoxal phosphate-dependent enzyme [Myxococcota bacterium]